MFFYSYPDLIKPSPSQSHIGHIPSRIPQIELSTVAPNSDSAALLVLFAMDRWALVRSSGSCKPCDEEVGALQRHGPRERHITVPERHVV